jgi:hypothetical protein
MWSFVFVLFTKYYYGVQIKDDETTREMENVHGRE